VLLATRPVGTSAGPAASLSRPTTSPARPAGTQSATTQTTPTTPATPSAGATPPAAAAAATFVGDLETGVADGQVTPQAGQDMFNHLQQLLFIPPGQDPQQVDQQYAQLVQAYDQDEAQGQITEPAATTLRQELDALGTAMGAL